MRSRSSVRVPFPSLVDSQRQPGLAQPAVEQELLVLGGRRDPWPRSIVLTNAASTSRAWFHKASLLVSGSLTSDSGTAPRLLLISSLTADAGITSAYQQIRPPFR